jgi:hypothetical protein
VSFAIWSDKPPFEFGEGDRERVYSVGAVWVVTDNPARATQAEVDAVLNPPGPPASVQRDRARDMKKLETAVADGDQASINSLTLKLLRG